MIMRSIIAGVRDEVLEELSRRRITLPLATIAVKESIAEVCVYDRNSVKGVEKNRIENGIVCCKSN